MPQHESAEGKGSARAQPAAAYFTKLQVRDIRCFSVEQTLDLSDGKGNPARWTLLLGNNGTGKTTLLEALVGFLPRFMTDGGWFHQGSGLESLSRNTRSPDESRADVHAQVAMGKAPILTQLAWETAEYFYWPSSGVSPFYPAPTPSPLVCYAYGASRRFSPTSLSVPASDPDEGHATLFSDDAQLRNPEEWLLRADYAALRKGRGSKEASARREKIERLLVRLLPDVEKVEISQSQDGDAAPVVHFVTPYGPVRLGRLGHGYRTMVAWVVDFASRLFERYPDLEDPLAGPAVALIDEIDLHLHPYWQRQLVPHLSELFPNTQFIATAHSPLIVQGAMDANIVVLRRENDHVCIDNDPDAVRNWRVDQILTSNLFELPTARPPQIEKALRRRTELLSKPQLKPKERAELEKIEREVGVLPTGETASDADRMLRLAAETAALLKKYEG